MPSPFARAYAAGMHVEWGAAGLAEAARLVRTVVVVDVLSFSTAVTVAAEMGALVHPYRRMDDYAERVARRLGARLGGSRGTVPSLSPPAMAQLSTGDRVLLASPNGAGLALAAAARGMTVVVASLRNAGAVGTWLRQRDQPTLILAAGERWRDGTPRVAVEDWIGAGAVVASAGAPEATAEARVAEAVYRAVAANLTETLRSCTSGVELIAAGFGDDVDWAAREGVSEVVPVLVDGAFRRA